MGQNWWSAFAKGDINQKAKGCRGKELRFTLSTVDFPESPEPSSRTCSILMGRVSTSKVESLLEYPTLHTCVSCLLSVGSGIYISHQSCCRQPPAARGGREEHIWDGYSPPSSPFSYLVYLLVAWAYLWAQTCELCQGTSTHSDWDTWLVLDHWTWLSSHSWALGKGPRWIWRREVKMCWRHAEFGWVVV